MCDNINIVITDRNRGTDGDIYENNGSKKVISMETDVHNTSKTVESIPMKLTLTNTQQANENISEFSYEATETNIENDLASENNQLEERLRRNNEQYGQLKALLQQKDELIELQKKELTLLSAEKESLKREYETEKKEKEHAVVRYAMLEKNIIDADAAKDLSTKKLRDLRKEVEALTNRVKFVTGERDKAHKESLDHIRENESLKYNLQTCETKLKWNQRNLTQEKTNRVDLEKKLNELTEQLNQLNEERQQQIHTEKKSEQEQGAQVIMMKHMVDSKERNLIHLQKTLSDLKTEFTALTDKYEAVCKDFDLETQKCQRLQAELSDAENNLSDRNEKHDELQSQLEECEQKLKQQKKENDSLIAANNKLKYIEESYDEQSEEMLKLRSKEDEYLSLLKDMTEKCVLVENKLILSNSKSSALMLDNERLNKDQNAKLKIAKNLEDELVKAKHKHSKEIKLFNRILADEKSHSETLQNQYDNIVGDLEATKNKHSQVVKELNRELAALRKRSNESSPSADSGFGTEVENKSTPQTYSNGIDDQEPSKKLLIDRIVKLQRQLAKQNEKIEFLENHCVALFNELKAKSS